MPSFNYQKEMINIFNTILEINSNDGIQKFVSKYFNKIGINKYTYHQINIFIKLLISQFSNIKSKLTFTNDEKNITE